MEETEDRAIWAEVEIQAPIEEVWSAWTTEDGIRTFFAPEGRIELRPGGAYEMYFNLDAPAGQRGGEGMHIMALQPLKMLSFTWNAPPELPAMRDQITHVTVRLKELGKGETLVTLIHDGWGEGEEWDAAFDYFVRAWGDIVLPRLQYRFDIGPVNWNNLPQLNLEKEVE